MMILTVDTGKLIFDTGAWTSPCTVGRSGACAAADKREGDGHTPLGDWPLLAVLFRPGRMAPPPGFALPWRWIGAGDGWSDDPADPDYNRPVPLPHRYSAETLARQDCLYDAVCVLGHNLARPVPGMGSAIFLHLWNEEKPAGERVTEGCVALPREAMTRLLPELTPGAILSIR